jgi:hypothetical protein
MSGLGLLIIPIWIGSLICAVIVLIKLFQNEGALKGILGIICGLYTFVWGWMNASRLGIKNIMIIWTILIVLGFIVQIASGGFSYGMR